MANPTDVSIDAATTQLDGDMVRVETELLRLLQDNMPRTVDRRNTANPAWKLRAPKFWTIRPRELSDGCLEHILLTVTEEKTTLGVQNFKTLSRAKFEVIAGRHPISPRAHYNSRRLAGIIASILAGADTIGNQIMLHWKDPDGYVLWAELVPDSEGITPFTDKQIYGHTLSYLIVQYPGANGTTTT